MASTSYQFQSYDRQYNQTSARTNDNNTAAYRSNRNDYSQSIPSVTPTPLSAPSSPRRYQNNYYGSSNDFNRFPSSTYGSAPYRPYRNDNETYFTPNSRYNLGANNRACSYDDLLNEQYRSTPSTYNSNNTRPYRQPQQTPKRDQYYDYDNDYDDHDIIVKSTDLAAPVEQKMLEIVRTAFRRYDITNQRDLAGFLKRAADRNFSPCWHCIVGKQFSSYVTHEMNGFIYFTKGSLSILLFKSGA